MKKSVRISTLALALLGASAAHGVVVLSFGTTGGAPLTALTAPGVGLNSMISVYYTSTTPISAAEVFTAYDRSTTQGTSAVKLDNKVSLTAPVGAASVSLSGIAAAGGTNTASAPVGTARPYGMDIQGVTASSGNLPASATPAKLFDVTLNNLALTAGQSYTLSFYMGAPGSLYSTAFYDNTAALTTTTGGSLVVTAPVPEPTTVAALGLGALAMLRRRKRA